MYERIKDLREASFYTQKFVASYLNVSQRAYSYYESGKRAIPVSLLCKLADLYKVSIDYIVERTDEKTPYKPSH